MHGASTTQQYLMGGRAIEEASERSPVKYSLNLPFKKEKAREIDYQNLKLAKRIITTRPKIASKDALDKKFLKDKRQSNAIMITKNS